MDFLYVLEGLRQPWLDKLMLTVTVLGEETAFLVAAILVFWCVDKKKGYYVMTAGFFGTIANQVLKLVCQVPRPWVLDPNFTIVEAARAEATGFSFPSGHSTSAVATFGAIGAVSTKRWQKALFFTICVLVPFSRMYLGVHTPADVLVGSGMAVIFVLAARPMTRNISDKQMMTLITGLLAAAVGMLLFSTFYPLEIAEDQLSNVQSGVKNSYTLLGSIVGMLIGYPLERKFVNFETKAVWWAQILKAVLGLVLVLAVKEGLKAPLDLVFGGHMAARAVRYCCVVLFVSVLWPMTFRWFGKLGAKK